MKSIHSNGFKQKSHTRAFTLAEVLVTLGIIGVVAAITIPIINNAVLDAQYKSAYKKAYSTLYQAFNDASREDLLVDVADAGTNPNYGGNNANVLAIMGKFKTVKQCTNNNNSACWESTGEKYGKSYDITGRPVGSHNAFIDSSGMAWTAIEWYQDRIALDTNGFKQPNQYGKDRFVFHLYDNNNSEFIGIPTKITPYSDNHAHICTGNKCATENNYYGTSWLSN